ncbi:MAG: 50S ribosomal protein L29 [Synechococcales bacterium]|nr:50S ribosomal protein L29 [Synechococcales bacterium]
MPLSKIGDFRRLSDDELNEQIVEAKRKLFELRFQKATRQLEKSHEFKHARHRIAQLMTVERERELERVAEEAQALESEEAASVPSVESESTIEEA